MKAFDIIIPIYEVRLIVSMGESNKKFLKTLKKYKIKCKEECILEDSEGYFIPFNNATVVLRMLKKPKKAEEFGYLSHEILHTTIYILRRAGFKLTKHSEEAYTYLQEYITTQVLKQIKQNDHG